MSKDLEDNKNSRFEKLRNRGFDELRHLTNEQKDDICKIQQICDYYEIDLFDAMFYSSQRLFKIFFNVYPYIKKLLRDKVKTNEFIYRKIKVWDLNNKLLNVDDWGIYNLLFNVFNIPSEYIKRVEYLETDDKVQEIISNNIKKASDINEMFKFSRCYNNAQAIGDNNKKREKLIEYLSTRDFDWRKMDLLARQVEKSQQITQIYSRANSEWIESCGGEMQMDLVGQILNVEYLHDMQAYMRLLDTCNKVINKDVINGYGTIALLREIRAIVEEHRQDDEYES